MIVRVQCHIHLGRRRRGIPPFRSCRPIITANTPARSTVPIRAAAGTALTAVVPSGTVEAAVSGAVATIATIGTFARLELCVRVL
jgi:hypothetical protein